MISVWQVLIFHQHLIKIHSTILEIPSYISNRVQERQRRFYRNQDSVIILNRSLTSTSLSELLIISVFYSDYLDWDGGKKLIEVPEQRNSQPNRNCMCKGPACICCVDFNITIVDLGGPGKVYWTFKEIEAKCKKRHLIL